LVEAKLEVPQHWQSESVRGGTRTRIQVSYPRSGDASPVGSNRGVFTCSRTRAGPRARGRVRYPLIGDHHGTRVALGSSACPDSRAGAVIPELVAAAAIRQLGRDRYCRAPGPPPQTANRDQKPRHRVEPS
jgi:hypothetical protein